MKNSDNNKIFNYQLFFRDQVKEEEREQRTIALSPINQLILKGELTYGCVDHVNYDRGHVIFKFPKNMAPRLKVQRSMVIISKQAWNELGERMSLWSLPFIDFIRKL